MSASLAGKVIAVSGATGGLGAAIARNAAASGAAGLVLAGRRQDEGEAFAAELTEGGCVARFVTVDMASVEGPAALIGAAEDHFGVVHGAVNVAAATGRDTVWDATASGFETMFALNVRTPMLVAQAAAKLMRAAGVGGSIVNIGSISGYGGAPVLLTYSASKGALTTLTKNLAYSLMRHRIRVNQVNPGWMATESEDATQRRWHGADDGWLARAGAGQPTGRLIKPDEVARLVCFLLSEESGLMTGSIVDFDQSVLGAGEPSKPSVEETPQ